MYVRLLQSVGVAAGLLLLSGVMMSPAMAALVTYNFTGDVTGVSPTLPNLSQSISGFITVNPMNTSTNPSVGSYRIQDFQLTYGSFAIAGGSGMVNISHGPTSDFFAATVNSPSGDLLGGSPPGQFEMLLFGPNNILTSNALPNPAPSISSFAFTPFRLAFGLGPQGAGPSVNGVLTSLTAVPLPAGALLFSVGLVALIGLRVGGLRNLRVPQA